MRSKRDIKMGRLNTRGGGGGQSSEYVGGGVTLNDAIPDENMPFFCKFIRSRVSPDFRLSWSKSYRLSGKKSVAFGVPPAYSWLIT